MLYAQKSVKHFPEAPHKWESAQHLPCSSLSFLHVLLLSLSLAPNLRYISVSSLSPGLSESSFFLLYYSHPILYMEVWACWKIFFISLSVSSLFQHPHLLSAPASTTLHSSVFRLPLNFVCLSAFVSIFQHPPAPFSSAKQSINLPLQRRTLTKIFGFYLLGL